MLHDMHKGTVEDTARPEQLSESCRLLGFSPKMIWVSKRVPCFRNWEEQVWLPKAGASAGSSDSKQYQHLRRWSSSWHSGWMGLQYFVEFVAIQELESLCWYPEHKLWTSKKWRDQILMAKKTSLCHLFAPWTPLQVPPIWGHYTALSNFQCDSQYLHQGKWLKS